MGQFTEVTGDIFRVGTQLGLVPNPDNLGLGKGVTVNRGNSEHARAVTKRIPCAMNPGSGNDHGWE
jgi:hypothetical protein